MCLEVAYFCSYPIGQTFTGSHLAANSQRIFTKHQFKVRSIILYVVPPLGDLGAMDYSPHFTDEKTGKEARGTVGAWSQVSQLQRWEALLTPHLPYCFKAWQSWWACNLPWSSAEMNCQTCLSEIAVVFSVLEQKCVLSQVGTSPGTHPLFHAKQLPITHKLFCRPFQATLLWKCPTQGECTVSWTPSVWQSKTRSVVWSCKPKIDYSWNPNTNTERIGGNRHSLKVQF